MNKINKPYTIKNSMFWGQLKDSVPYGIWSFKNKDNDDVLQIKFNQEANNLSSYSIKQFNSEGKVIYYCEYFTSEKPIEIETYLCDDLNDIQVGGLLYETHIKNHILLRRDYKKIYGSNRFFYLQSILDSLKENNSKYPVFKKKDLNAIFSYLDQLKKPIP